jgi:diguanylate cyclase (GGDEF)-like protein/PAS domain S-box-containing protein
VWQAERIWNLARRIVIPSLVAVVFVASSLGAYRVLAPMHEANDPGRLVDLVERLRSEAMVDSGETSKFATYIAEELGRFDRDMLPEAGMLIALAEGTASMDGPRAQALELGLQAAANRLIEVREPRWVAASGPLGIAAAGFALLVVLGFVGQAPRVSERTPSSGPNGALSVLGVVDLAHSLFEHSGESVMITDAAGRILAVNSAYCRSTGYPQDEVLGRPMDFNSAGHQGDEYYASVLNTVRSHGVWQGELWHRRGNGEAFVENATRIALYDASGQVENLLSISADISSHKDAEKVLAWQSNHDALTKLPNRSLFQERLSATLRQVQRDGGVGALLLIDLDRFKGINEMLGHSAGDQLLIDAAHRLAMSVRETDTLARLGGDEFAVIMPRINREEDVERVARKILDRMDEPFRTEVRDLSVTASVGIALLPTDGSDVDTLVSNAENAMYRAKEQGRNAYFFFESAVNRRVARRLVLEHELRKAVVEDQLSLRYQPIINLDEGCVGSVEALLRWEHPKLGEISPSEFIPVAEESGLIVPIGYWIVESIQRQLFEWHALGIASLRVAINVSARQLSQPRQKDELARLLKAAHTDRITLEITESLLMENEGTVREFLLEMQEAGVKVALDDFGTGYSSLSYLRRFNIDALKIDKSFIEDIETNENDQSLVATIVSMGRTLGLQVVAEGVESVQQVRRLGSLGCDCAQGYHYCKPVDATTLERFLVSGTLRAAV